MSSKYYHPLDVTEKLRPVHLWVACVAILLVGMLVSLWTCQEHFSRSGAVVVALAVGLFALDPRKDPEFYENLGRKYFPEEYFSDEDALIPSSTVRAYHEEEFASRTFIRNEGYIVMIGTLVWGFGDLIALSIMKVTSC